MTIEPTPPSRLGKISRQQLLALALLILVMAGVWIFRDTLAHYLGSLDEAKAWMQDLGALGPIVLILLNALQIVLAPIPGYVVQVAAGWVYGVWPGALYGTIGLALGAFLAVSLARVLGRPFVARIIGETRLQEWEHVVHADSGWLWAVLFLGPVGDIPYFLAGLSQYPIPRIVAIAVLVRTPSVILATAVGAGLVTVDLAAVQAYLLARPYLIALFVLFAAMALFLYIRYGSRLRGWFTGRFTRELQRSPQPAPAAAEPPPVGLE